MQIIIQVENISKTFAKDNHKHTVLQNLNFNIIKGEILCILGPSGCGKSTLLRHIAGFDRCDSGSILMNGKKIKHPQVNRVLVFQDFNQLFPWKTVLKNIMYPLKVNNIANSNEQRRQIAEKYLDLVKLRGFNNHYPYQLSGGMKQKAAIARALALNPEVLLMDEPFGSLDALTRKTLQEMLLDIWRETGVTIVFVTHDIEEAILLSDRLAVMGRKPGQLKILDNILERPRKTNDPQFIEMFDRVYSMLEV